LPDVEKDRLFLQAGIQELPDYLLAGELYWPLSANLPRLTVGGLLLAMVRLRARSASGAEQAALTVLQQQIQATRTRWRAAWENKAGREMRARLGLWQNYLADYRHSPEQYADAYPQEVRWRSMLHLLMAELPASPPEAAAVLQLDSLLKACLLPGEFIWETDLMPAFPRREYWFLYGKLKAS